MVQMIRTAEEMARAIETAPDTEVRDLLAAHAARIAEYPDYDFSELAEIVIVQPGDDLDTCNQAIGWSLLNGDEFAHPVELIDQHRGWYEVTFILSDDGFGLVLLVPIDPGTDKHLLAACERGMLEA